MHISENVCTYHISAFQHSPAVPDVAAEPDLESSDTDIAVVIVGVGKLLLAPSIPDAIDARRRLLASSTVSRPTAACGVSHAERLAPADDVDTSGSFDDSGSRFGMANERLPVLLPPKSFGCRQSSSVDHLDSRQRIPRHVKLTF